MRLPLGVLKKLEGVCKMSNSLMLFGLGVREHPKVEMRCYKLFMDPTLGNFIKESEFCLALQSNDFT